MTTHSHVPTNESNQRELVEFLSREFGRSKERQCMAVRLFRAPQPGGRGVEMRSWHREEEPGLFESLGQIEELSRQIVGLANQDATTLGPGRHRFSVRTTQLLGAEPSVSFAVVIDSDDEFPGLDGNPDPKGQIAQQMKHTEWLVRSVVGMTHQTTISSQQQIKFMAQELERQYERNARLSRELEELKDEESNRMMAMELASNADRRKDEVLQNIVLPLAPLALTRLLGKGGGDDSVPGLGGSQAQAGPTANLGNALIHTLGLFVDSLQKDQDQAMKLLGTLTPEQKPIFMQVVGIIGEARRVQAEAKAAQSPAPAPAPAPTNGAAVTPVGPAGPA